VIGSKSKNPWKRRNITHLETNMKKACGRERTSREKSDVQVNHEGGGITSSLGMKGGGATWRRLNWVGTRAEHSIHAFGGKTSQGMFENQPKDWGKGGPPTLGKMPEIGGGATPSKSLHRSKPTLQTG